jgi:hypothetical protein
VFRPSVFRRGSLKIFYEFSRHPSNRACAIQKISSLPASFSPAHRFSPSPSLLRVVHNDKAGFQDHPENRLWQKQEGDLYLARTAPKIVGWRIEKSIMNKVGCGCAGVWPWRVLVKELLPVGPEPGFSGAGNTKNLLAGSGKQGGRRPGGGVGPGRTMTKPAFRTTLKTGFGKKQEGNLYQARTAPKIVGWRTEK